MKVTIVCTKLVRFCQTVKMSKKDFETLKKTPAGQLASDQGPLTQYLDQHNPDKSHGFQDIEIYESDALGRIVDDKNYISA